MKLRAVILSVVFLVAASWAHAELMPGLDVRAWQGQTGIEGTMFDLPGTPGPNHSTFAGTLGYATGAIDNHRGSGVAWFNDVLGYTDWFTVEYRGKLKIDTSGTYCFATSSDDGSALWIDPSTTNPNYDTAAVQNGKLHSNAQRNSAQIILSAGYHDFIVRYYQGGGGADLSVLWDPNGGTSYANIPGANYFHTVDNMVPVPATGWAVLSSLGALGTLRFWGRRTA
ncbi:MAG: PA14 domain-containing protein [Planctomycetota bacterium]|nr:PA14 domain-containing protein [Planctomycetota bacterium]